MSDDKTARILMAQQETIKPTTAWLLFLFLGWSYGSMGSMGLQIPFLYHFGWSGDLGAYSTIYFELCN